MAGRLRLDSASRTNQELENDGFSQVVVPVPEPEPMPGGKVHGRLLSRYNFWAGDGSGYVAPFPDLPDLILTRRRRQGLARAINGFAAQK
ncbi:hypothetical protein FQN55_003033 [Onygenales sp. PD_40]|nr:hypothetical protein FQN55_003033 [Onygenales sp. PD_40]